MLALAAAAATLALAGSSLATTTITAAPSPSQVQQAVKRAASQNPLTDYTYSYSAVPYQVLPAAVGRGPQSGYNICNSTTSGPDSQCQTLIANNASDFCLWGSPTISPNGTVGNVEAAVVAYCTNDKHGTRVIPAGAITGLQLMHTSAYIQWTGHINMTALGFTATDTGGELDPHGADLAGNPLGGLVYSNQMPGGNNQTELQAIEWNNFIGSGVFCLKLCFDDTQKEPFYCENKFDLIGCSYNMPAAYQDNVFLECDGDLQDVVGTYTGADGLKTTWSQPTLLPATSTLPWTPRVPASSNCKTYQSTDLFPNSLLGYQSTSTPSSTASSASMTSGTSAGASAGASASRSGASGAGVTGTSANAAAQTSKTSGANEVVVSGAFGAILAGLAAFVA